MIPGFPGGSNDQYVMWSLLRTELPGQVDAEFRPPSLSLCNPPLMKSTDDAQSMSKFSP